MGTFLKLYNRWTDVGIVIACIVFNLICVFLCSWLFIGGYKIFTMKIRWCLELREGCAHDTGACLPMRYHSYTRLGFIFCWILR